MTVTLAGGTPVSAMILDVGARTLSVVDYQGRHYFTSTVEELRQTLQGAQQGAMPQMEEAKSLPPARRRMVEEMMRRSR